MLQPHFAALDAMLQKSWSLVYRIEGERHVWVRDGWMQESVYYEACMVFIKDDEVIKMS